MRSGFPRVYIDLTDVAVHAIWHPTCGGIPRVQLEVAKALVRSNPNAVPFSLHNDTWRNLRPLIEDADGDSDKIILRLKASFPYPGGRPSWRRPLYTAKLLKARLISLFEKLRSRTPDIGSEDTLFVGGAFWMNRNVIELCGRAAAHRANLIVLFHDLIPLTNPQFTGHDFTAEYLEVLRLPAHFIVTTPFNRNELETVRKRAGAGERTSASIVPLADEFPGAQRNARFLPTPNRLASFASRPFVLCVGTIEIRKNHAMLLSVWEELAAELGDRLPTLVVAGRRGWKADAALRRLDEWQQADSRIVFVELPVDEELQWLYCACMFTVFPSLFEGWGLPVGESFWFGKPCAASNTSSIPTAGRDLCLYFSPNDAAEMKAAICRLLDPELRRSYQDKIATASLRSWAEVAGDIERVIIERCRAPIGHRGNAPVSALETGAY